MAGRRRWPGLVARVAVASVWSLAVLALAGGMGLAWLAGWRLEVVRTGSMAPEIPVDALAVTRPVAGRTVDVGDVVAYREPTANGRRVLHRVVDVEERDGQRFLQTQGDANRTPDPYVVPADRVEDRLLFSVPRLGVLVRLLQPPRSYLVLVGLPLLAGAVGEVRRLRRRRRSDDEAGIEGELTDVSLPVTVMSDVPSTVVPTTVPSAAAEPGRDRRGVWVVAGAVALGLTIAGQRLPTRERARR